MVFWVFDKAASDGVRVDVPDLFVHVGGGSQVAVVSPAALPESMGGLARGLRVSHLPQKLRAMCANPRNNMRGHRSFELPEYASHGHAGGWLQNKVDMLGHDDVGEQVQRTT